MTYNLLGAVFLAIFGAVYESFSHEVYSYFMIYAFMVPLVMGACVYMVFLIKNRDPGWTAITFWNASISAFALWSVFRGILEIYGTTNAKSSVYPVIGAVAAACAVVSYAVNICKTRKGRKKRT